MAGHVLLEVSGVQGEEKVLCGAPGLLSTSGHLTKYSIIYASRGASTCIAKQLDGIEDTGEIERHPYSPF